MLGRGLVDKAGVPVRVERSDTSESATLARGEEPAVVRGLPGEIVLFLFGREQHSGLEFSGPEDAVRQLHAADLGM